MTYAAKIDRAPFKPRIDWRTLPASRRPRDPSPGFAHSAQRKCPERGSRTPETMRRPRGRARGIAPRSTAESSGGPAGALLGGDAPGGRPSAIRRARNRVEGDRTRSTISTASSSDDRARHAKLVGETRGGQGRRLTMGSLRIVFMGTPDAARSRCPDRRRTRDRRRLHPASAPGRSRPARAVSGSRACRPPRPPGHPSGAARRCRPVCRALSRCRRRRAYGLILPAAFLEAPRLGCVNIHASMAARRRSSAPHGRDAETGITVMQDEGLTGGILSHAHRDGRRGDGPRRARRDGRRARSKRWPKWRQADAGRAHSPTRA